VTPNEQEQNKLTRRQFVTAAAGGAAAIAGAGTLAGCVPGDGARAGRSLERA